MISGGVAMVMVELQGDGAAAQVMALPLSCVKVWCPANVRTASMPSNSPTRLGLKWTGSRAHMRDLIQ